MVNEYLLRFSIRSLKCGETLGLDPRSKAFDIVSHSIQPVSNIKTRVELRLLYKIDILLTTFNGNDYLFRDRSDVVILTL